jgi:hypothetical protein
LAENRAVFAKSRAADFLKYWVKKPYRSPEYAAIPMLTVVVDIIHDESVKCSNLGSNTLTSMSSSCVDDNHYSTVLGGAIFVKIYETHIHHIVFRILLARGIGGDGSLPLLLRRTGFDGFVQPSKEPLPLRGKVERLKLLYAQSAFFKDR